MKYAQNNFKSTFGSAYFNSNKTKLKLAKPVKKEPRKASLSWLAIFAANEICTDCWI